MNTKLSSNFDLYPIGSVDVNRGNYAIHIDDDFRDALLGLDNFSHGLVFWWATLCDDVYQRQRTILKHPYNCSTDDVGIFATRSPMRPNPIAMSVIKILSVDHNAGAIIAEYIDAEHDTPVIDIKPYFPASDRVENCSIPSAFNHWPQRFEDSAIFDWSKEFRMEAD